MTKSPIDAGTQPRSRVFATTVLALLAGFILISGLAVPNPAHAEFSDPCCSYTYDQFMWMQNGIGAYPPMPYAIMDYGGGGGGGGGSVPVPECTLDLTKDLITWTSTNASDVFIAPLTNSPTLPATNPTPVTSTVFTGDFWNNFQSTHFSKWKTDAQANGGVTLASSDAFYADKLTADRLCAVTFPGSVADTYQSDSFSSPDNNTVARWDGTKWLRANAKTWPNTHFRYTFTCVKTETTYTFPLSGSHAFSPALGEGTHTYRLTANGYGGSVQCDATVTITPPPPPSAPTCDSFTANPNPIEQGNPTTISWQTTNATSVSIGNGIGAVAVDGSKIVSPNTTTTYTLTASGPGGPVECKTTVTVNPPPPQYGCINILKETFDPNGTKLSPVAQFTFKLDGTTLAYNDANGNASFTNVTPGTHQVSEIVPTTWDQLSVTPANGTVVVSAGPQCAGVVFKNRQVLPPPPPPSGECKLEISKSVDKTQVGTNEIFEYTISFKNIGNKDCTGGGVKVYDKVDSRTTYVSETHSSNVTGGYGSNPVYSSSAHELYWNAATLTPGESGWVKWKGKVKQLGSCSADVLNKAKITSKEYNNFQTWETSNEVVVTVIEGCPPPPPPGECELVITKSVNKTKVEKNEVFEYTINFENTGDADCTGGGVKVVDVVNAQITYVSETHSSNVTGGYGGDPVFKSSDRTLRWNGATLTPGEKGWVKWKGKITSLDQCSVTIPNVAKITAKEYNNFQTWVTSNEVMVTAEKNCPPPPPPGSCKLVITKSVNTVDAILGEQFEYTINFENTGDEDCTGGGVRVLDVIDPRITYVSETHSSNVTGGYGSDPVYTSSDHTLRWNAGTLNPGEKGWVKWKGKVSALDECSIEVPNVAKITSKEYDNFQIWIPSNTVKVDVAKDCPTPNVPVCTLTADPTTINATSGTSELRWTTTNATEFALDHGIGTSTPVTLGTKEVTVSNTTTYHGLAIGPGGAAHCEVTITVVPPQTPVPVCTLSVSPSKIKTGQSVTVSWTSSNVNEGFINGTVGSTTPVSNGSVPNIFPSDDFTYVGTFTGPYGTVTCSAPVEVETGGGGCAPGLCPGGMNQPNVSLFKQPGEQPLAAFVYLSQIPYTGFEAGAALTMIFWTAVALFALLLTYFLVGRSGMQGLLAYAFGLAGVPTKIDSEQTGSFGNGTREYGIGYPVADTTIHSGTQYAERVMAPIPPVAYAPVVAPAPATPSVAPIVPTVEEKTSLPSLTDVIESRAHASGVLISPEAVASSVRLSSDRAEALVIFGDILNKAIQMIPREDGWVMLTSDRFELVRDAVMTKKNGATPSTPVASTAIVPTVVQLTPASVPAPVVETSRPASATESAAIQFAGAVLSGDRDTAFGIIRSMEKDGLSPISLMVGTAAVLDRIYRLRKGGRNGVDPALLEKSTTMEDEALMRLVEIFAHPLDQAYANPFTGVKLALAQAFDIDA